MSSIKQAVIISAVRTPVGKLLGALKSFKATDLGAIVVREAVKRAGVRPEEVDEVRELALYLSHVGLLGDGDVEQRACIAIGRGLVGHDPARPARRCLRGFSQAKRCPISAIT